MQLFTESYFRTDINLNCELSSLIFLNFRNNLFQGTLMAYSKGVNFVPSEYQNHQNNVILCHSDAFIVNIKLN